MPLGPGSAPTGRVTAGQAPGLSGPLWALASQTGRVGPRYTSKGGSAWVAEDSDLRALEQAWDQTMEEAGISSGARARAEGLPTGLAQCMVRLHLWVPPWIPSTLSHSFHLLCLTRLLSSPLLPSLLDLLHTRIHR